MNPLPLTILLLLLSKSQSSDVDTLNTHNKYRTLHGVTPLQWSTELAGFAQTHCTNLAVNSLFEHSKGSSYGENLYFSFGYAENGARSRAVDAWYKEIEKYDFEKPGYQAGTGHFTQVQFV